MNDYEKLYLTRLNKVSFAASGFGQNLIIGIVNSFLLFFYTDIFLLPASAAATLMLTARIFDAVNDPIMGNIVDKTRTRWGKLRPYLFITIAPLCIITILLFYAPNLSDTGKLVYAYVTYISFGIIYTICDVPFWGLASAMTPNPQERIKFISISRLFHSIGGALPIVLIPLFLRIAQGNDRRGFFLAGIFVGIIGAALFSLSFFGTKERCNLNEKKPSLIDNIRFFLINRPLQIVVISNVIGFTRAMAVVSSMYIATYLLKNTDYNIIILGAWGVSGYLGMLFTPKLARRFNYRKLYYIGAGIGIFGSALLFILGYNIYSIAICMFICGFPYGLVSNINYSMIADSVDYVEWKTGKRTEGVSISFQTLMNKLMSALQIAGLGYLLVFVKFVQPIEVGDQLIIQPQSDKTLNGLFFTITFLPMLGWLLSIIPMMFYNFIGDIRIKAHKELIRRRESLEIE